MKITATSTNRNLISTTISIISTIHLLLLLPVVGGSFKNRKPIGDVGCCESRMAERIH